jgi:hypothetical protein
LSVELPRNVIDSKKQWNQDANFVVFQDGQFGSASDQLKTDAQVRVLSISFDNGTEQIEIAGTQLGPAITPQVTTSTPTTINPANATKAPANVTAAKTSTNATSAKSSANVTTASKTTALSNPTANLKSGSKMHPLNYRITGGGNNLSGVSLEKDSSTLLLSISQPSHGTLTIEFPRNIIDSKRLGTNHDESHVVIEDGRYVPAT